MPPISSRFYHRARFAAKPFSRYNVAVRGSYCSHYDAGRILDNRGSIMSLPVIGIPCSNDESMRYKQSAILAVQQSYVEAVARSGGAPVLIPLGLPVEALGQIAERLDGLLLAGGADVSPHHYGAERHPAVKRVDEARDATEIWLARWALKRDVPLLAICRGLQVLNVAAGGTLFQDIKSEYAGSIKHDRYSPAFARDEFAHSARLEPASRLRAIFGATGVMVNSRHHQAVRNLGEGLAATAWAPDNVIEGLEARGQRFVVAVQWHPENLIDVSPAMHTLFRRLRRGGWLIVATSGSWPIGVRFASSRRCLICAPPGRRRSWRVAGPQ